MTEHRRDGSHPNHFSREIRQASGGGTIPDEWGCRVVDLDHVYMLIADEVLQVAMDGRIWLWYDHPDSPQVVAVAELKKPTDRQQSWAVTKSLALKAGVPGFKITRMADGVVVAEDLEANETTYSTARDFIETNIAPLIATKVAA